MCAENVPFSDYNERPANDPSHKVHVNIEYCISYWWHSTRRPNIQTPRADTEPRIALAHLFYSNDVLRCQHFQVIIRMPTDKCEMQCGDWTNTHIETHCSVSQFGCLREYGCTWCGLTIRIYARLPTDREQRECNAERREKVKDYRSGAYFCVWVCVHSGVYCLKPHRRNHHQHRMHMPKNLWTN